ncbi:2TM domain-containing protein [Gillisia marina]|uniref:2TM domain-containing protein n=1 Tax=Gillisia marina TaxID=1167637 RepID=UPI0003037979|nr:2TM domain-containing protein [Gillisia marina]
MQISGSYMKMLAQEHFRKKRLFQHFVIFLVGAVLLIVLNVVIGYQEDFMPLGYNWFVWAILAWSFFLLYTCN